MNPQLIGWLSLAALLVLLFLRVPVAFVLGTIGFLSYLGIKGLEPSFFIVGGIPYSAIAQYSYTVVPLFIIMGHFANQAGFITDIFDTARKWVGNLPGGMVQATIAGASAFGAACGSGVASCAIVGKIAVPQMLRYGVQRELAFGAVATVGGIAVMIPPSVMMVVFGIITETSIGKLLIAGIIPGIVAAVIFMAMVYVRVKLNPGLVPKINEVVTWKERLKSLKGVWGIALVALIVMGGIYTGVFTPTEAGAVGAFSTFVMALALRKLTWSELGDALLDTTRTTGMVFLILACASMFAYLMAITRIPTQISDFIVGLQVNRYWIIVGIMLLFIIMGTFIDMISAMLLTMPIIFPSVIALGFDPIWFGVLMVFQSEVCLISPPFALNIFVLRGVIPDSTTGEIIRGILPFFMADMAILALYIAFPQLSLWLPSLMG